MKNDFVSLETFVMHFKLYDGIKKTQVHPFPNKKFEFRKEIKTKWRKFFQLTDIVSTIHVYVSAIGMEDEIKTL